MAQDPASVPVGERTASASALGLDAGSTLQLERAVTLAIAHHPAMVQARQAVVSSELALDTARGGRRPTVSASGSVAHATNNRSGDSPSWSTDRSYGASVSLDLLLLDFGKSSAGIRQAVESLFAAEQERRSAELDTIHAVRAAFFDLLRTDALLAVAVENQTQVARQLEQAKALAEYGRRQPYDVSRANVQLGTAALETISASNSVIGARAALNRALGLAEDPGYRLADGDLVETTPDLPTLMAAARDGNPELAALHARARAASAGVDAAIADLYPDLKLGADAALSGAAFPLAANASGVARLAAPLWDGHARRNRIAESVAQLRTARSRIAAKEQQLFQELTIAVAQQVAAEARLEVAASTASAAAENAELTEQRYRLGVASAIEQADAQSAVTSARAEQIKARCDRWLAFADIARLTGASQPSERMPNDKTAVGGKAKP
jgi:outer membrane protein